MSIERNALLNAITDAAYGDDLPWLAYADWLDEQGDSAGAIIRQMWETPYAHSLRNLRADTYDAMRALAPAPESATVFYHRGWMEWTLTPDEFLAWDVLEIPVNWPIAVELEVEGESEFELAETIFHERSRPGMRLAVILGSDHELTQSHLERLATWPGLWHLTIRCDIREPLRPMRYLHKLEISIGPPSVFESILIQPRLEDLSLVMYARSDLEMLRGFNTMRSMREITLSAPRIPAEMIAGWAESLPLQVLALSQPSTLNLSDALFDAITSFPTLRNFWSWDVRLSAVSDPAKLARLERLERLTLGSCHGLNRDSWMQAIAKLPRLTELDISGSRRLKHSDLAPLAESPRLAMLDVGSCRDLSGRSPKTLGLIHTLQGLDIEGCTRITPRQVARIQSMLPQCRILSSHPTPSAEAEAHVD